MSLQVCIWSWSHQKKIDSKRRWGDRCGFHHDVPLNHFLDWKRKQRGIHMTTHTADICFSITLNQSFCILLPWHNLDVLLVIKVNFSCLLWCPPYHFWHNGCYDLSDWRDVTFFQIFQWFAWWQKHDNRSWVNLGESWVKKKLHSSSEAPLLLESIRTETMKDNIRADKTLGCLPCIQQTNRLRYRHI